MQFRASSHETRRGATNVRAVLKQTDVVSLGVLAALFKAMRCGLQTYRFTVGTGFDAFLHLGVLSVRDCVRHSVPV